MSYRESLQIAEIGGVKFHASAADTGVGRRTVVHEFPGRDTPFCEDMGKAASDFVLDGFLVGEDYLDRKNELIRVLIKEGPHTLIHPSMGTLQVSLVSKARLREQFIERRGMVTFSLSFVEAGNEAQPTTVVDTQQAVEDACDDCYAAMEDDFASSFSIDDLPGWSVDSIADEIGRISDVITSVRNGLQLDLSALSVLNRAGNLFKSNLVGLLATPGALATELSSLVRGIVGLFDFSAAQDQIFGGIAGAGRPIGALLPLGSYGKPGSVYPRPVITETTPVRRMQAANQAAVFDLIARAAVVESARTSVYVPFNSVNEANTMREQLYDALDELLLDAPDNVYASLKAVQVAMVRDITARGADLMQLSTITLPGSMPARVLAYLLYGSGDYADEIVARNQAEGTVLHPLFMPGSTLLEVRRV